ncbi:hypothetical protein JCM3770_002448 [Rhodotorula araucariae]
MTPFPLSRKRSSIQTLSTLTSPSIAAPQTPRTRTQRALSRLSRFRLSSIRDTTRTTPAPTVASQTVPERPLKQARRQSRSFSTFFSSSTLATRTGGASSLASAPLSPLSLPLAVLGERDGDAAPTSPLAKRATLKRTISYPVLQSASSPVDAPGDDWWGVRDATVRIELAQGDSSFAAPVAFPRLPPHTTTPTPTPTPADLRSLTRSWNASDESLVLDTPTWSIQLCDGERTPNETSRFSFSTESRTVSSCAPSSAERERGRCAVLDVFDAPPAVAAAARESAGSPLDLDFALDRVVPLSPPPSPGMYRHQPVIAHGTALGAALPSPPPARWSHASASEVVDPDMLHGFSYAMTPPAVRAHGLIALTPPCTPRIVPPAAAEVPSPFLLPHAVADALGLGLGSRSSFLSLALEELTSEMDKLEAVELLHAPGPVLAPFPRISDSDSDSDSDDAPPAARPDTPTPFVSPTLRRSRPRLGTRLRTAPAHAESDSDNDCGCGSGGDARTPLASPLSPAAFSARR